MNIVKEAKYLLCGLSALIDETRLNIVICESENKLRYEKEKYEKEIIKRITHSNNNKTMFGRGGGIIWRNNRPFKGYSARVIILIGLDESSLAYKELFPCTVYGAKIFML